MPKYQDAKIYALKSHQTDDVYIGSTCQKLEARKAGHMYSFKNELGDISSFKICRFDDCYVELVEDYPCTSKEELHRRAGEAIL